jgi:hypothetical protein
MPNEEGVLVEKLSWPTRLYVPFIEGGVLLFDESDLFGCELHTLLGRFLFQLEPALATAPETLLVEKVLDGGSAHRDAFELQLVASYAVVPPCRVREAYRTMIISCTSSGVII